MCVSFALFLKINYGAYKSTDFFRYTQISLPEQLIKNIKSLHFFVFRNLQTPRNTLYVNTLSYLLRPDKKIKDLSINDLRKFDKMRTSDDFGHSLFHKRPKIIRRDYLISRIRIGFHKCFRRFILCVTVPFEFKSMQKSVLFFY